MSDKTISLSDIEAAENLLGIEYSQGERELMVDNLEDLIASAQARRNVIFPNALPPATTFDPRLPTTRLPAAQKPISTSKVEAGALPENDVDIAYSPVTQLSEWIRSGQITSRRLVEIYIDRIKTLGPQLECVVTVLEDLALEQADDADRMIADGQYLGPLHGIPYGMKDLFDTKNIRTTWGAVPYKDRIAKKDARIVTLLREAGAVLVAKTTLGALAYGDIWFGGVTRNPWNIAEGASGSSAGSASATAAGLVGFSIGTETLGSITSPSQRCGTTGLRPTFGRVSRSGAMALCWSLDKIGPICRTVEDTVLVLSAINGFDSDDKGSISASFNYDASSSIGGLRVGYIPASFEDEGSTDVDRDALDAMRQLNVELVEVSLPELPYMSLMNVVYAEAAAAFEELTLNNRDDELVWQAKGAWPNIFRKARFLSAVDHVQLDRLRYKSMQVMDEMFSKVDFMIGPFMGPMLVITNFTGHPCLHLRAGFCKTKTRGEASLGTRNLDTGQEDAQSEILHQTPHGISLWSGLFDEGRLCNLGAALEKQLNVWQHRPPIG